MSEDCPLCADKFNGSKRKRCSCPYCKVDYCRECLGTWLTTIIDEPKCPNEECKKSWSREYVDSIMTKVWRENAYRNYRENLLMDRERALLPSTQPRIEAINEAKRLERDVISALRERNKEIQLTIRALAAEQSGIQGQIWDLLGKCTRLREGIGVDEATSKQQKAFVRRCPSEGCRGFLSTAWKCGVCELYSCPDCHEVKGAARDSIHTCDPGNVETAKLLSKDTKPCPKCGEMITKIDGCDQMWCISCHTAFSWRSGQIANGTVHNPHYYEWQRMQNNGNAPRVAGDIPCGGLNEWSEVRNAVIERTSTYPAWVQTLELAHRKINHVLNVDMPALIRDGANDNIDLRIQYLLNEINDDAMKSTLVVREKRNERDRELRRIYETLTAAASDIFRRIIAVSDEKGRDYSNFKPMLSELETLRKFINEAIDSLRRRYTTTVHGFDNNWDRLNLKKKRLGENDLPEKEGSVRTIYGRFVDELAKFRAMEIVAPKANEDGRTLARPYLNRLRVLQRLLNNFPNTGSAETSRLATRLINYHENNINAVIIWTTGTRAEQWQRQYHERIRDRYENPNEKWDAHAKTLELVFENPTNDIIT